MTIRELLNFVDSFETLESMLDFDVIIFDEGSTYPLTVQMLEMLEDNEGTVSLGINL